MTRSCDDNELSHRLPFYSVSTIFLPMSALDDGLIWPGCFGDSGSDWEQPGAMEAVAARVVSDLAACPKRRYGPATATMQLVDWHCDRRLPLPVFVVESLAAALDVGDHLRWLEAIALDAQGATRAQIAARVKCSLRTLDRWRAEPLYKNKLAAARERGVERLAFGRFAIDEPRGEEEAIAEVDGIARHCADLRGDPKRGDDYSLDARRRLLEITLWFSARGECAPDALWLAIACALGLATYKGGLRTSVHDRHHPERYHFTVLADSEAALGNWSRRVASGELNPVDTLPALGKLVFPSDKALSKSTGVDRKTLARWRTSAGYQLARFVNILSVRRQENDPIILSPEEHNLIRGLVAETQREHEEQDHERVRQGVYGGDNLGQWSAVVLGARAEQNPSTW